MTGKEIRTYVELMINNKLELEEFFILMLVMRKEFKILPKFIEYHYLIPVQYQATIEDLQKRGWLKITGDDYTKDLEIRALFTELFTTSEVEKRVEEVALWIQQYREIFKRRQGAMGDPNACLAKMKRFVRQYPQYTKEHILKAAEIYVDSCGPQYRFLQQADYFISKESSSEKIAVSRLLNYLEDSQMEEEPTAFHTEA